MRKVLAAIFGAATLAALVACSRASNATGPQQPPPAAPAPLRSSAPGPSQRPAPPSKAAQPQGTPPSRSGSPAPKRGPTMQPAEQRMKVPRLSSQAPPRILDVAMSETTVQAGDRVSGSVVTSSNVASVEARIGGYAVSLVKVGVGRFALTYTVGPLPFFVRGNFTMRVIARNQGGEATTRTIPLTVR
ncbi:MAG: hypothetical protein WBE77_02435 [Candidatus Cybelea sp.]